MKTICKDCRNVLNRMDEVYIWKCKKHKYIDYTSGEKKHFYCGAINIGKCKYYEEV